MKQFRQILNFPNYKIDTNGNVYSKKNRIVLKPIKCNGYKRVHLRKHNKTYFSRIHRLVLETFVGLCPEGMECCHNNGNPADNRLSNLRWDTKSNNQKDSVKLGTHHSFGYGESHMMHKLKEKDIINIIYLWNTKLFRQQEIADMYNIKQNTVSQIVNGKIWKHI